MVSDDGSEGVIDDLVSALQRRGVCPLDVDHESSNYRACVLEASKMFNDDARVCVTR